MLETDSCISRYGYKLYFVIPSDGRKRPLFSSGEINFCDSWTSIDEPVLNKIFLGCKPYLNNAPGTDDQNGISPAEMPHLPDQDKTIKGNQAGSTNWIIWIRTHK